MLDTTHYLAETLTRHAVNATPGDLLLDFGTDWCGHCQAAQPAIAEARAAAPQLRHIKIEDGPGRPLGRSFKVKLWPTLVLLRNGEEVAREVRPTRSAQVVQLLQR